MNKKGDKKNRERGILPVFIAIPVSFILAIFVSINSLTMLARENTKELDTMLTYRIYDSIASTLNEPINVSKTMACNGFIVDFLEKEKDMDPKQAEELMRKYLSGIKNGLGYNTAFLISENSKRYYTYEGLNKVIDPVNDEHDVWYKLFVDQNVEYDLDVDSDEMNKNVWTIFVNTRIVDENGKLLGVCGVGVQMTNLQEMFAREEKEYNVKINLVDKNGLVQVDTEDINIENAWLDGNVLSHEGKEDYQYQTTNKNEFAVTKYVEYLGWYLVVRSKPTTISKDFVNVIVVNVVLSLMVMGFLILMIGFFLKRIKKERDARQELLILSERAVAASDAKSSFLSSMSHEIRTPINAVLGMNEMILREATDKKIIDYATNIRHAGRTLLTLINSILDFSKIEEGKMEIVPVTYDTASLVNNIIASVDERAKAKKLRFLKEIDKNLPSKMIGDDVRLQQVIANILTNAVKYTEDGHVRLTIREEKREGDEIELYVAVTDTGIGIRKEDLPKLFKSFERLDLEKNHSIEGTGLGMAIVTNLLKMMGSEIQVDSEYGKGSVFYFVIRQKIADAKPMGDYKNVIVTTNVNKDMLLPHADKAKVLVVDDNEMNLKVAKNLLGLFGINAELANSGQVALYRCKRDHFHLILLDHMMPKMDGKETLERMKKEKLIDENTKVIALTANAIQGAEEDYLKSGFDGYISKPIEMTTLEKALKKYLPDEVLKDDYATEEVIEFTPASSESKPEKPAAVSFNDYLKEKGFETDKALTFCAGDAEFYKEILSDYVSSFEEKKGELDRSFKAGDWHDFEIKIHALKGVSKTIGATALSEQAYQLEKAATKKDDDFIRQEYEAFMKNYAQTVDYIKQAGL